MSKADPLFLGEFSVHRNEDEVVIGFDLGFMLMSGETYVSSPAPAVTPRAASNADNVLVFGTPTINSSSFADQPDAGGDPIAANEGVVAAISTVGTAGNTYIVDVSATTSGGARRAGYAHIKIV